MKIIKISIYCLVFSCLTSTIFAQTSEEGDFVPSGNIYGYAFGDMFYKLGGDALLGKYSGAEYGNTEKGHNAVGIRRVYFGYKYNISPNFKTQVLFESSDGVLTSGGSRTVFIKALNLEWLNLIPRASIIIGQSSTPTWSLSSERIWGYRSVEKTIADFRGLGSSNDMGIRVTGKIDEDGVFGYSLMWAHGQGRGARPENNSMKKVYAALNADLLDKKLFIEVYADYEDYERFNGYKSDITLKGFVAYRDDLFTLGIESYYRIQEMNKIYTDVETGELEIRDKSPLAMSVFLKLNVVKDKITAFVRYDTFNPDYHYLLGDNTSNPYDETFFLAGLDYNPHKNVHIMPNIWINSYKDKRDKPDNYDASTMSGIYYQRKADVVPRLTFFYRF